MLENLAAIITRSGRGIGRAAARLASERINLVVGHLVPEPAAETVKDLVDPGGGVISQVVDVTAPELAKGIEKSRINQWGGLPVKISKAGFTWKIMIYKMADKQWEKLIDLDLKTPCRIRRVAKPYFGYAARQEFQEGHNSASNFINIPSVSGLGGKVGQVNYSSAKSGVIELSKTIGQEWASKLAH